MVVQYRSANSASEVPMELLLLADPSEEMINNYIKEGSIIVAEMSGEVIGVIVLIHKDEDTMEIINIAVKEDFQREGIGKQLINKAMLIAKRKNVKRIEIGTGNSSLIQLGIYQRYGFRIFEIWEDYFTKHYEEEIYENRIQCRDMVRLKIDL